MSQRGGGGDALIFSWMGAVPLHLWWGAPAMTSPVEGGGGGGRRSMIGEPISASHPETLCYKCHIT